MEEIKTGVFKILDKNSIYIVGDIHGDYQCLIHCLVDLCKVANIVSIGMDEKFGEPNREYLEWEQNNNSIVIFTGDLIHRQRFQDNVLDDECSDIYIIKTILRLKKIAKKNGGDIIIISGNHEIMNIVDPMENTYTSSKNIESNKKYFNDKLFVNNYISNSYAWIKINDILIAHGGLCSDYLKFLDNENIFDKKIFSGGGKNITKSKSNYIMIGGDILELGNDIIDFVNNKYRNFFTDYNKEKIKLDPIGFKLFIHYDFKNKHNHNVFWCREWGYSGINCDNFTKIVKKIDCNKMIIAHCPQFLSNDKPKMINFECEYNDSNIDIDLDIDLDIDNSDKNIKKFKIARVDLGMSRSFEYNKQNDFFKFLFYNYNRKMSVLKLSYDESQQNYYFNYNSIITNKISCIQYLLIKYGMHKQDWIDNNIVSNWLGFEYIENILKTIDINNDNDNNKLKLDKCNIDNEPRDIILCLLYPLYYSKPNLKSANQFFKLKNN